MFDDTAVRIHMEEAAGLDNTGASSMADPADEQTRQPIVPWAALPKRGEHICTKLLQTRQRFGMVLKATLPGGGSKLLLLLRGHMSNHVQAIQSTATFCLVSALIESNSAGVSTNGFRHSSRLAQKRTRTPPILLQRGSCEAFGMMRRTVCTCVARRIAPLLSTPSRLFRSRRL